MNLLGSLGFGLFSEQILSPVEQNMDQGEFKNIPHCLYNIDACSKLYNFFSLKLIL